MQNPRKLLVPALIVLALGAMPAYAAMKGGSCHGQGYSGAGMGIMSPDIHEQLQLTQAQEQTWQEIDSSAKALRDQRKADRKQVKATFTEELAKAEPDLARVQALRTSLRANSEQAWKDSEAQQLAFYASMTPQQKTVVKQALLERMERKGRHGHGDKKHGDDKQQS